MKLVDSQCVPCHDDTPQATDADIVRWREELPDWKLIEEDGIEKLQRTFVFADFQSAMDFTHQVGQLAEAQGHHPAIHTEWGKVIVIWWTQRIGGLHQNDFICAARTDALPHS